MCPPDIRHRGGERRAVRRPGTGTGEPCGSRAPSVIGWTDARPSPLYRARKKRRHRTMDVCAPVLYSGSHPRPAPLCAGDSGLRRVAGWRNDCGVLIVGLGRADALGAPQSRRCGLQPSRPVIGPAALVRHRQNLDFSVLCAIDDRVWESSQRVPADVRFAFDPVARRCLDNMRHGSLEIHQIRIGQSGCLA